jgi:hypothetical protein
MKYTDGLLGNNGTNSMPVCSNSEAIIQVSKSFGFSLLTGNENA